LKVQKRKLKVLKQDIHRKSNQICYLKNAYIKKQDDLCKSKIDCENIKQNNIDINKQNENVLQQINHEKENHKISTKTDKGRFTDEMRTCILELSSLEIPTNMVVNSVGKFLSNTDIDAPSKTTVQNIISECNVITKQHVAEQLAESENWGVFSDGTSRDGKKIIDIGVHTDEHTYSLGYQPVAVENAETVSNVIKETI